jgi:hypothetical protein
MHGSELGKTTASVSNYRVNINYFKFDKYRDYVAYSKRRNEWRSSMAFAVALTRSTAEDI